MITNKLYDLCLLKKEIEELKVNDKENLSYLLELEQKYNDILLENFTDLEPFDRVLLARSQDRPKFDFYLNTLFTDLFEFKGDRLSGDDKSVFTGVAKFNGINVTVISQKKGYSFEQNLEYNFGMNIPSGYRKIQRIVKMSEKFNRPIITFIDTPGAYPGIEAEKTGQGEAIARSIELFSDVKVPVISVIIGEGGSGGALAIGICDKLLMLENSVFSILSPEGFATILWKDSTKVREAANLMELTANELFSKGVVDRIIKEPLGGIITNKEVVLNELKDVLYEELTGLMKVEKDNLVQLRYEKYRVFNK